MKDSFKRCAITVKLMLEREKLEKMKIQYLNGGLANQVFQYIFARFIELYNQNSEPVFLDDSFFFVNNVHNGYELERVFGIKANLLSKYFTPDAWEKLIDNKRKGISICQSFQNMGVDMVMIAEGGNYMEHNPFYGTVKQMVSGQFQPKVTQLQGNIYYHGYWINKEWLESFREEIMEELQFPPLSDLRNLKYAEKMLQCNSVAIHVRRGDYVSLHLEMHKEYYAIVTEKIVEQYPDAVFFVFSDDPAWCKMNADELGLDRARETVYVMGNVNGKNYIDLHLMTMCRGMILSNSAFCYLAALMSDCLQYYINPVEERKI